MGLPQRNFSLIGFKIDEISYVALLAIFVLSSNQLFSGDTTNGITLSTNSRLLLHYNTDYQPSPKKEAPCYGRSGFLHPVYTPKGKVITSSFPEDHLHQHGIMFAWTNVKIKGQKIDFWNSHKKQGRVEHRKITKKAPNLIEAELLHIAYSNQAELPVIREQWKIKTIPHNHFHIFELTTKQYSLTEEPLEVLPYKYGGLCVRGPFSLFGKASFETSEGNNKQNANHTRPNWVTMSGLIGDGLCGITVMSHPSNLRHPQYVRIHPEMPYLSLFPNAKEGFKITKNIPYVATYRFIVFDDTIDKKELQNQWTQFSHTIQNNIVKDKDPKN